MIGCRKGAQQGIGKPLSMPSSSIQRILPCVKVSGADCALNSTMVDAPQHVSRARSAAAQINKDRSRARRRSGSKG
jgi:hypothetical protein